MQQPLWALYSRTWAPCWAGAKARSTLACPCSPAKPPPELNGRIYSKSTADKNAISFKLIFCVNVPYLAQVRLRPRLCFLWHNVVWLEDSREEEKRKKDRFDKETGVDVCWQEGWNEELMFDSDSDSGTFSNSREKRLFSNVGHKNGFSQLEEERHIKSHKM